MKINHDSERESHLESKITIQVKGEYYFSAFGENKLEDKHLLNEQMNYKMTTEEEMLIL